MGIFLSLMEKQEDERCGDVVLIGAPVLSSSQTCSSDKLDNVYFFASLVVIVTFNLLAVL